MPRDIRPDVRKSNKYYISKERYYELKHFCLQYSEWKQGLLEYSFYTTSISEPPRSSNEFSDPISRAAIERESLQHKIDQVELAASLTDKFLANYILLGVTKNIAYPYLQSRYDIPCCRDVYYDRYRKFFWILSSLRD